MRGKEEEREESKVDGKGRKEGKRRKKKGELVRMLVGSGDGKLLSAVSTIEKAHLTCNHCLRIHNAQADIDRTGFPSLHLCIHIPQSPGHTGDLETLYKADVNKCSNTSNGGSVHRSLISAHHLQTILIGFF